MTGEWRNGVYIPEGALPDTAFEKLYLKIRQQEQRVYSNVELMNLPEIAASHKHHYEWSVRKESCKNLINYLKKKKQPLRILEIGCGNGWLSNKLSEIPETEVVGLDINLTELQQAAEVFTNNNLQFVYGDMRENILRERKFDMIIFAGSIPYFSSLAETMYATLDRLATGGEIHIIDSFFYNLENAETAKQNCRDYYMNLGFPDMANYYYHHLLSDIGHFNYEEMQPRLSFFKKLFSKKNVFPWLRIRHAPPGGHPGFR